VNISGPRRFLLCTDGLSDTLTLDEMESCVASSPRPALVCQALLTQALQANAKDNVTLIVADIEPVPTPASSELNTTTEEHPL
jgi:protein phosphatase